MGAVAVSEKQPRELHIQIRDPEEDVRYQGSGDKNYAPRRDRNAWVPRREPETSSFWRPSDAGATCSSNRAKSSVSTSPPRWPHAGYRISNADAKTAAQPADDPAVEPRLLSKALSPSASGVSP